MKLARNYSLGGNLEYIASLLDNSLGHRGILKRDLDMPDADCNMELWHKEQIIVGDVDEVLRRLLELMEESGPFGTLVLMGFGWGEKASWIREEREKGTVSFSAAGSWRVSADRPRGQNSETTWRRGGSGHRNRRATSTSEATAVSGPMPREKRGGDSHHLSHAHRSLGKATTNPPMVRVCTRSAL